MRYSRVGSKGTDAVRKWRELTKHFQCNDNSPQRRALYRKRCTHRSSIGQYQLSASTFDMPLGLLRRRSIVKVLNAEPVIPWRFAPDYCLKSIHYFLRTEMYNCPSNTVLNMDARRRFPHVTTETSGNKDFFQSKPTPPCGLPSSTPTEVFTVDVLVNEKLSFMLPKRNKSCSCSQVS
ncbi:hypothetical protein EVAR_94840_1 [Eumeta japonica]|uniref:Uncharacterized protein n=1 Tax=Eumeta variegata TaxID=151549 RepID=A0A4C1UI47_EUMVA|nr:hypothetical protein EVAR_94840_1 [Eumeta japonica]